MSSSPTTAAPPRPELRCANCDNDGTRRVIRYLVDVVCCADVSRLGDDAVLALEGSPRESVRDPHARPRFECSACGHRWPVPDGISRITWQGRS